MSWKMISIKKEIYKKPIVISNDCSDKKIKIELYLPPADIPDAIFTNFNKDEDIFEIQFKYSVSEKEKILVNSKDIVVKIGVRTGKPIAIKIKNIVEGGVTRELENIINMDLEKYIEKDISELNYRQKANIGKIREFIGSQVANISQVALV